MIKILFCNLLIAVQTESSIHMCTVVQNKAIIRRLGNYRENLLPSSHPGFKILRFNQACIALQVLTIFEIISEATLTASETVLLILRGQGTSRGPVSIVFSRFEVGNDSFGLVDSAGIVYI